MRWPARVGAAVLSCLLLGWLSMGSPHVQAAERVMRAQVTYVSDGDTLWVRTGDHKQRRIKLRLLGIDAPELCQRHGETARAALRSRVDGRDVIVRTRAVDAYGRVLAQLSVQGSDVAAWLVREGHAWSPGFRGRPGRYAAEERAARAARRGLFSDASAVTPREFRQTHGHCPRGHMAMRSAAISDRKHLGCGNSVLILL